MFGKKKKDLALLIQELVESKPRKTQGGDSGYDDKRSPLSIRDLKVSIEVNGLEDLIKEVRELKDVMKELVDLIKERVESEEETEKQQ